jgi:nicotinate-nucleotide adenylyltransferase
MGFCGQVKAAIFGGSFNPVHCGHLALAEEVLNAGYDKILFVPVFKPPHKNLAVGAAGESRIAMLRLALEGNSRAEIWDGEIRRGGFSYSIDTVRELKSSGLVNSYPGLIIGDDLLEGFPSWKHADELAAEVELVIARRNPGPTSDFGYQGYRLENELWPYSSTDVRARISRAEDLSGIVPDKVVDYIRRNSLYGYAST